MARIGRVRFGMGLSPLHRVQRREESIRVRHDSIDPGQVQRVREGQGKSIDFGTADHEHALTAEAIECGVEGRNGILSGEGRPPFAGEYEIAAPRECSADALGSLASHQNRVAKCEPFEPPQIVRQMPGQRIVAADGALPIQRRDDGERRGQGVLRQCRSIDHRPAPVNIRHSVAATMLSAANAAG